MKPHTPLDPGNEPPPTGVLSVRLARWIYRRLRALDSSNPRWLRFISPARKLRLSRMALRWSSLLLPSEVTVDGIRLRLPKSHTVPYLFAKHEGHLLALLQSSLRPGSRAADVGANIGYWSLQMAKLVGSQGRTYAIEPSPENVCLLLHNARLNRADNLAICCCGASRSTTLRLFDTQPGSTRSRFRSDSPTEGPSLLVPSMSLDDFLSPPLDFVKIDVEGHETEVLEGMERILRESPNPTIFLEWHVGEGHEGSQAARAPAILEALGMRLSLYTGGSDDRWIERSAKELADAGRGRTRMHVLASRSAPPGTDS